MIEGAVVTEHRLFGLSEALLPRLVDARAILEVLPEAEQEVLGRHLVVLLVRCVRLDGDGHGLELLDEVHDVLLCGDAVGALLMGTGQGGEQVRSQVD